MQLHHLQRMSPNKRKRQVGRGGKRGKTSGRGTKGQLARAGHKLRPELRDIIKKIPKRRGYRFQSKEPRAMIVTLATLAKAFPDGGAINPRLLVERRLVAGPLGQRAHLKVLGPGAVTARLTLSGLAVSQYAKTAIEQAGGSVEN